MPDNRIALAEDETAVAVGAAACIDVWMGGDRSWRTRGADGPSVEFMAGADWEMAVLLTKAVLSAVIPEGSRIIAAGHLPMPQNAEEAKAMWLFSERWMRDNAPDALRADHDAGGAVAMREAAAKACDARARMTFSAPARIAAEDLAAEIRALPLASQEGPEC